MLMFFAKAKGASGSQAVFGIPAVYFVSDLLPQIRKKVYFAVHAIGEIR